MTKTKKTIILGIDPGLADTGYGIIEQAGNVLKCFGYGIIKTKKGKKLSERLGEICQQITKIIKKYQPDYLAIEEIYFCKNVKTALLVGQAKGAILLTGENLKLKILEYTPLQVKLAVTSYGRADKNQIQQLVKVLLQLKEVPQSNHAADALAVAICCAHSIH